MKSKAQLVALAAAVVVAVAWAKRPVKPPPNHGRWTPTDSERTRR